MDREEFATTGILRIEGAFDDSAAARMCDVIWAELADRHGIERDDPSTWDRHQPTGLRTSKRSKAFAPILGPPLRDALDGLFGPGGWQRPRTFGNVLVTMPTATRWRVPHRVWHSDFQPTLPADRLVAVKLWALCDDVGPGGGGTPQLVGSHRAFARYLATTDERDYKRTKLGFLASHPWLRMLTTGNGGPSRDATLMAGADLDGVHVSVVETTGRAGDVWITHPWVFHSIAVNASDRPRLMRSVAVDAAAPPGAADRCAWSPLCRCCTHIEHRCPSPPRRARVSPARVSVRGHLAAGPAVNPDAEGL